jgi:hypothetical protein
MTDVEQNRKMFYQQGNFMTASFHKIGKTEQKFNLILIKMRPVREFTALRKLPICFHNLRHLPDSETSSVPSATAACPFPVTDYYRVTGRGHSLPVWHSLSKRDRYVFISVFPNFAMAC